VKADFAFGGFRLEIRGGIANRQRHNNLHNRGSTAVRPLI
jgi:hypothetical protein